MDEKPLMLEIMHIHKEWQNYMKKIAQESGIPESYRMIIMFLSRNPGVSQKEVAAFCGTTYAAVSQTIKEMHLTGFIRKETSASDQRYSMLYLTDKGTEYAMKTVEKFKAADAKITETLGYENERRMASEIKKLSEVIKKEL